MSDITLPVIAGSLPQGFCPPDYQTMLNGFSAAQSVKISQTSGATATVVSASKPPSSPAVIWLQIDPLGRPIREYWFGQGAWLSLHPMTPGLIVPWVGPLPTFNTFDGGDANALSPTSGPMWEVVPDLQGKFPIGAGTLPSGAVVNQGDVAGNDQQKALLDHKHVTGRFKSAAGSLVFDIISTAAGSPGLQGEGTSGGPPPGNVNLDTLTGDWIGTDSVTNIPNPNLVTVMPPYVGINFLRRTARLYYSVT